MKLQRFGSALLKPDASPSPLLSFLAPAIAASSWIAPPRTLSIAHQPYRLYSQRRCLSTTRQQRAATSEARKEEDVELEVPPNSATQSQSSTQPRSRFFDNIRQPQSGDRRRDSSQTPSTTRSAYPGQIRDKEALKNILATAEGKPHPSLQHRTQQPVGTPTPMRGTDQEQAMGTLLASITNKPLPLSSADELKAGLAAHLAQNVPTRTHQRQDQVFAEYNRDKNLVPPYGSTVQEDVRNIATSRGSPYLAPEPPMRLDAYIGRAEPVNLSRPLPRALALLGMKLSANKVRATATYQRFHERKGLKRKRLRRERWRAKFKEGFKAMVGKVKHMRRQGW